MKKLLALLLAIALILALVAACGGDAASSKKKVAISLPPADNAWQAKLLDHVLEETAKYDEYEWTVKNAVDDNDQLNQLNIFKGDNFDLIMILPGNGTLLTPICEEIFDAGIPTVILDRPIESDKYTALVAGDNYGCGVNAANFIGEQLGGEGQIAYLRSYVGIPIDLLRYQGFVDTIVKYPGISILVEADGEFNREAGNNAMTNILPAYPHIDALVTHDDEAALGALVAIENANRTDIRYITGMGGTKGAYEKLKANDPVYVASMSYFPRQAIDGVEMCLKILKGESFPKDTILPSITVTSANVDQFMAYAYG